jgi:hypothetical protein
MFLHRLVHVVIHPVDSRLADNHTLRGQAIYDVVRVIRSHNRSILHQASSLPLRRQPPVPLSSVSYPYTIKLIFIFNKVSEERPKLVANPCQDRGRKLIRLGLFGKQTMGSAAQIDKLIHRLHAEAFL